MRFITTQCVPNETITLSTSHILYGWHYRTKHWQVLNYCLLLAKYHIFCTSLCGDILDFQIFLLFITGKLEILKEIATAKKRTSEILSHLGIFYFNFHAAVVLGQTYLISLTFVSAIPKVNIQRNVAFLRPVCLLGILLIEKNFVNTPTVN